MNSIHSGENRFFIPKTIVTEKQIRLSGKNMGMGLLNEGNALRRQMQSFAWALAKLCVDGCKALRERMQSFALADAMLCV